jgi:hypothetical protein
MEPDIDRSVSVPIRWHLADLNMFKETAMTQPGDAAVRSGRMVAVSTRGFVAWSAAGFLAAGALISAASVGLFILPVAVIVLVLVARTWGFGPATFGFLGGVGAALLGVALLTAVESSSACSGVVQLGPGQTESVTCGPELSPAPWIVAGLVCWGVALAGVFVTSKVHADLASRRGVGGDQR